MPPGPTGRLMIRPAALLLLGLLLLFPASLRPAQAAAPALAEDAEGIRIFFSEITIGLDRSLRVRETLTVLSAGGQIVHGLYRDIPATRSIGWGLSRSIPLEVIEARLDGRPLPYFVEPKGKGETRVRLGDWSEKLSPTFHVFEWTYVLGNMVESAGGRDECGINLTGDHWTLPINKVSTRVKLPIGADEAWFSVVQGTPGRKRAVLNPCPLDAQGGFTVGSLSDLGLGNGASLFLSWPTGLVKPLDRRAAIEALIQDNLPPAILLAGFVLVGIYFWLVWAKVGGGQPLGLISERREAPPGISPGLAGMFMTIDQERAYFLATLFSMLARGILALEWNGGKIRLLRGDVEADPRSMEQVVASKLFTKGSQVALKSCLLNNPVRKAKNAMMTWLDREIGQKYVRTNNALWGGGVCGATITVAIAAWMSAKPASFILAAAISTSFIFISVYPVTRYNLLNPSCLKVIGSISRIAFNVIHLFLLIFVLMLIQPPLMVALLASLAGLVSLFHYLLRQPTLAGHDLKQTLQGYQLYLSGTQGPVFHQYDDLDVFARNLPFAVAFDLGSAWQKQFDEALSSQGIPSCLAPIDGQGRIAWDNYLEGLNEALDGCVSFCGFGSGGGFGGGGGGGGGGSGGGGGGGF